jgi:hypothetical protein
MTSRIKGVRALFEAELVGLIYAQTVEIGVKTRPYPAVP